MKTKIAIACLVLLVALAATLQLLADGETDRLADGGSTLDAPDSVPSAREEASPGSGRRAAVATGNVRITVVCAVQRVPLAGVQVHDDGEAASPRTPRTDITGTLLVPVADTDRRLTLSLSGYRQGRAIVRARTSEPVTVRLEPLRLWSLRGSVHTADGGDPVEGAVVAFNYDEGEHPGVSTKTDAAGSFEIGGVVARAKAVLSVSHQGFRSLYQTVRLLDRDCHLPLRLVRSPENVRLMLSHDLPNREAIRLRVTGARRILDKRVLLMPKLHAITFPSDGSGKITVDVDFAAGHAIERTATIVRGRKGLYTSIHLETPPRERVRIEHRGSPVANQLVSVVHDGRETHLQTDAKGQLGLGDWPGAFVLAARVGQSRALPDAIVDGVVELHDSGPLLTVRSPTAAVSVEDVAVHWAPDGAELDPCDASAATRQYHAPVGSYRVSYRHRRFAEVAVASVDSSVVVDLPEPAHLATLDVAAPGAFELRLRATADAHTRAYRYRAAGALQIPGLWPGRYAWALTSADAQFAGEIELAAGSTGELRPVADGNRTIRLTVDNAEPLDGLVVTVRQLHGNGLYTQAPLPAAVGEVTQLEVAADARGLALIVPGRTSAYVPLQSGIDDYRVALRAVGERRIALGPEWAGASSATHLVRTATGCSSSTVYPSTTGEVLVPGAQPYGDRELLLLREDGGVVPYQVLAGSTRRCPLTQLPPSATGDVSCVLRGPDGHALLDRVRLLVVPRNGGSATFVPPGWSVQVATGTEVLTLR